MTVITPSPYMREYTTTDAQLCSAYLAASAVSSRSLRRSVCFGLEVDPMTDIESHLSAGDEEKLAGAVSDEALEAAALIANGNPTVLYSSYCFTCPE